MSDVKYLAYKSKDSTSIDFINSPGVFIEADLQFNTAMFLHKLGDLVNDKYICKRIDFSTTTKFNKLNYLGNPDFVEITKEEFQIVANQFIQFLKKAETLNQFLTNE